MVILLEMTWGDGWGESAYVSFDWDTGRWYCRPPAASSFIAMTQSGLFMLRWYRTGWQFLGKTTFSIHGYSYNTVSEDYRAFQVLGAPCPTDPSPKEGRVFIHGARNPYIYSKNPLKWVRLRP